MNEGGNCHFCKSPCDAGDYCWRCGIFTCCDCSEPLYCGDPHVVADHARGKEAKGPEPGLEPG